MTIYEDYADNFAAHYFLDDVAAETDYASQTDPAEEEADYFASEKAADYCLTENAADYCAYGYAVETGYCYYESFMLVKLCYYHDRHRHSNCYHQNVYV